MSGQAEYESPTRDDRAPAAESGDDVREAESDGEHGRLHRLTVEDDPAGTTDPAEVAGADSAQTAHEVGAAPEHSEATG